MSEDVTIDISIEIIANSNTNVIQTFVDHYLLPDMDFNGHCLVKTDIYIP